MNRSPALKSAQSVARRLIREGAAHVRQKGRRAMREKAMLMAQSHLRLIREKRDPRRGLQAIPNRIRRSAKQLELMIELIADFRGGRYRAISWMSMALMTGAVAYSLSPADVIPDALIGFGLVDDAIILSIATGTMRQELAQYCEFKGYDIEDYFRDDPRPGPSDTSGPLVPPLATEGPQQDEAHAA